MNADPQSTVDRIPLAHSVRYVARGLPEVPNQYGPGLLVPSEITLTYRSAPDSQLGRVHAYVAGRIWADGAELPLLPGGLYGQHYDDGLDGWPEWLAEEARLHEPAAGRVVSAEPVPGCLFCLPDSDTNQITARTGSAYVRRDNYPAAKGHVEVVPVRHVESVLDLTPGEITDMHALLREVAAGADADGWTIGINEGRAAGQTIAHVHMHLIPRRWGDVPDPRGGVRHVLPGTDPDVWAAEAQQ